jgi:glycoside/pentoside/hexuronide:cation symporter, GPH family
MATASPKKHLSLGRILLYSLASAGLNILAITVSTWLLYFYSPPIDSGRFIYLPMAFVGTVAFIVSLWDAVIDPFIGQFSDNLRSKWGRRKPFIIFGAPATAILVVLIWTPPMSSSILMVSIYFLVVNLFYNTAYSLVGIPYDATMPEMAPEAHERVKLSYFKGLFGIFGVLIGTIVVVPLFSSNGPLAMGIALAVVGLITLWGSLLGLKETDRPIGDTMPVWEGLKTTLRTKQFLFLFFSTLFVHITYQMVVASIPYFTTLVIGKTEGDVMYFEGVLIVAIAITGPLWMLWNRRKSQRDLIKISLVIFIISLVMMYFVGGVPGMGVDVQAYIALAVAGVSLGGYLILIYAMMGNVVDYDEMLTNRRREANYYGTFSLGIGLGSSIGMLVLPFLLNTFGYTRDNPAGVRIGYLVMAVFVLIGLIIFQGYRLGETPEETRRVMGLEEAGDAIAEN